VADLASLVAQRPQQNDPAQLQALIHGGSEPASNDFASVMAPVLESQSKAGLLRRLLGRGPDTSQEGGFRQLQKQGWHGAGRGMYGTVLSRSDEPYVMKLFNNRDKAYSRYLDLIKAKSNPHFPQIRGGPLKVNDRYSAVGVEKLRNLNPLNPHHVRMHSTARNYLRSLDALYSELAPYAGHPDYSVKYKGGDRGWFGIERLGGKSEAKKRDEYLAGLKQTVNDTASKHPPLADALDMLHEHVIRPSGSRIDLHQGNMMFRDDGTPVITDPVIGGKEVHSAIVKDPEGFKPDEGFANALKILHDEFRLT
jgi:hypothetical protein